MKEAKELLSCTLNDLVDELVRWKKHEGNNCFVEQFESVGLISSGKKDNRRIIFCVLAPLIILSDYAEEDRIKSYCKKNDISLKTDRDSERETQYRYSKLLKIFSYHLIRESCRLQAICENSASFEEMSSYFYHNRYDNLRAGVQSIITQNTTIKSTLGEITVEEAFQYIQKYLFQQQQNKLKQENKEAKPLEDLNKEVTTQYKEYKSKKNTDQHTGNSSTAKDILGENAYVKYSVAFMILFDGTMTGGENMGNPTYVNYEENIFSAIDNGAKQIVLTGAPGTGKTRMAKDIAIKKGTALPWSAEEPKAEEPEAEEPEAEKTQYELVQFHPSYDYTDFIEGLRPVENADGKVEFRKLDGIFKRFCRHVAEQNKKDAEEDEKNAGNGADCGIDKKDFKASYEKICKENKYFFLIDEINRADLSKVFGELMYCLESDKRGEKNKIQTQYQNLTQSFTQREYIGFLRAKEYSEDEINQYFEKKKQQNQDKSNEKMQSVNPTTVTTTETADQTTEQNQNQDKSDEIQKVIDGRVDVFADGFYIPENVIIIGTMNDIDRSVESMDYALRRRFLWKEIEVSEDLLKEAFKNFWNAADEIAKEIATRVMALNAVMTNPKYSNFGLNRQYYISQGQLANLPTDITNKLEKVSKDNTAEDSNLKEFLKNVFEWRIEPLLREYVRGEDEETVENFITACISALKISDPENNTGANSGSKTSGT